MSTLTKIPHMRAINADKVMASKIQAAAAMADSQTRLANIRAAASDPKRKIAFNNAVRALGRLGFAIDQIAASGGTAQIDEAMKKLKWSTNERIALKANLSAVGALA